MGQDAGAGRAGPHLGQQSLERLHAYCYLHATPTRAELSTLITFDGARYRELHTVPAGLLPAFYDGPGSKAFD